MPKAAVMRTSSYSSPAVSESCDAGYRESSGSSFRWKRSDISFILFTFETRKGKTPPRAHLLLGLLQVALQPREDLRAHVGICGHRSTRRSAWDDVACGAGESACLPPPPRLTIKCGYVLNKLCSSSRIRSTNSRGAKSLSFVPLSSIIIS